MMRQKILFLDGIRGLAALYVLVHHARWVLWEGYTEGYLLHPENYTIADKFFMYFFSMFRYGHEAVILFFVLSGFVIHLRYANEILRNGQQSGFDFLPYLKRRFRRIYPPLILAIIATFALDYIGLKLGLPIYTFSSNYSSLNENILPEHGFINLLGNMSFLMKVYVPVWGTNGPLWSLAYEWWFYLFYPLFFFLSRKSVYYPLLVLTCLAFLTNSFSFFPLVLLNHIFGLMITWWFGAFLADIFVGRINLSFLKLRYIILIPFVIWGAKFYFNFSMHTNYHYILLGIAYVGLFALCFTSYKKNYMVLLEKLKPLGDMSYSVYILHMPLLVFFSTLIMMSSSTGQDLPSHSYFIFAGIIGGLLIGYLGFLIAEKPFFKRKNE